MSRQDDKRKRWLAALCVIGHCAGHIQVARASQEEITFAVDGQVRERFESISHPGFGLAPEASDDYLLHRVTLAANVAAGRHFALNSELVSAHVSGAARPMSGAQDDPLDVLQFYADGKFDAGGAVRLRAGRQTLAFGSARLVSTRDNTNVRRSFDGVRATWTREGAHLDAFYLRPVTPKTEDFDDRSTSGQTFWGLYLTRDAGLDLYYLGFHTASELRHSVGARSFGVDGARDWNFEAVWQWGSSGASRIRAWTLSSDVGYTLTEWPLKPRLGLKADIISGDRNPHDATVETFNPLFPKLNYFSDANIAVPANLFDVQPTVGLALTDSIRVSGSWNVLWRYSRDDGFYLPPLKPVMLNSAAGRYLGQQWSSTVEWKPFSRATLAASFVSFRPGASLREAGGASGQFLYASVVVGF